MQTIETKCESICTTKVILNLRDKRDALQWGIFCAVLTLALFTNGQVFFEDNPPPSQPSRPQPTANPNQGQNRPQPQPPRNRNCQTFRNEPGTCIRLADCGPLNNILANRPPNQANRILRRSICGSNGFGPLVCCPGFGNNGGNFGGTGGGNNGGNFGGTGGGNNGGNFGGGNNGGDFDNGFGGSGGNNGGTGGSGGGNNGGNFGNTGTGGFGGGNGNSGGGFGGGNGNSGGGFGGGNGNNGGGFGGGNGGFGSDNPNSGKGNNGGGFGGGNNNNGGGFGGGSNNNGGGFGGGNKNNGGGTGGGNNNSGGGFGGGNSNNGGGFGGGGNNNGGGFGGGGNNNGGGFGGGGNNGGGGFGGGGNNGGGFGGGGNNGGGFGGGGNNGGGFVGGGNGNPTAPAVVTTKPTTTTTPDPFANGATLFPPRPSAKPVSPVVPSAPNKNVPTVPGTNIECGFSNATHKRIVGGHDADKGAWPWMAALGYKDADTGGVNFLCGGALVSDQHVVTASHCVHNRDDLAIIRFGDLNLFTDDDGVTPVDVPVAEVIKNPNYNPTTFQNDIAVIRLKEKVPISFLVHPICLPTSVEQRSNLFENDNPFVAGWGAIQFNGPTSVTLREVQLPVVSNSICEEKYKPFKSSQVDSTNICAGFARGGKDACQGDSGGPLMMPQPGQRYILIGVVSYGFRCAEPGFPGVYSRVTSHVDWIIDTMKNK
ncbi:unnamed protein product [Allacma fusca]|uniref:CLIP domain-containing serine protease n=1 Tax=Allacma fusca TaxID=39272 RepID=A0A8J2MC45_9HEXA|nr:unnamed protein product [Allacma fusca]